MGSAIDTESIIKELRTKHDTEILEEVLEEIQNSDDVYTRRPEIDENEVNTREYNIPYDQQVAINYEIDVGQRCVVFLRIANMINNGISPNILICGKEQRGKSNTALYIIDELHNSDGMNILKGEFDPANQVLYDVVPFLLFYRHNSRVAAMFEEAAETLNKNNYNSKMNTAVAGTLRTQGKKQIPNFFVTPEASELDPRIVEKIDIEIEMVATGKAKIRFYERIHGKESRGKKKKYRAAKIKGKWNVPRARKSLVKKYEEIDSGFKGRYLDELIIDAIEEKIEDSRQSNVMRF